MKIKKGKTPLVVFPSFVCKQTKFTLFGRYETHRSFLKFVFVLFSFAFFSFSKEKKVSPSAEGDQRPTALDPCRLLKKAGENF